MEPAQHVVTKNLDGVPCRLLFPEDVSVTCSGGQGAMQDYGIYSGSLTWQTRKAMVVHDGPWTTHLSITFTIIGDTKNS